MKLLLFPITAAAITAGIYLNQKQDSSYNVLDYIPADTPLFTGQLTPFPIKDYLVSTSNLLAPSGQAQLDVLSQEAQPALKFLTKLMQTYQPELTNPEQFVKTFGLADNVRGYFYTLGLLPVFKLEVANPQAIWDLLDKAEQETNFTHQTGKLKELEYRRYTLTQPQDKQQLELIVAQSNGLLTVTLNGDIIPDSLLANALGLEKVTGSLAKSAILDEIIKKHKLTESSVGFFNHIEIIKGLTTTEGNQLAKQLTELAQFSDNNLLGLLHTPECAKELTSIANNWPRTVFGYSELEINDKEATFNFAMVLESKNQTILKALQSLRGYIPDYNTEGHDENILDASLGIDIDNLSSALTDIWSDLQKPSYQCLPLAKLQGEIAQSRQSLAMVGMFTNMVAGIKGLSTSIFDYTLIRDGYQTQVTSLDALFAIHADNPELIFNSVKALAPELQQVMLENNGPSIPLKDYLSTPVELNINPQLAIKGKHLVIYNGVKSKEKANKLGLEPLSAKGVYQMSFNAKKAHSFFSDIGEKFIYPFISDIGEKFIYPFISYNTRLNGSLDINEQGIRFENKASLKP